MPTAVLTDLREFKRHLGIDQTDVSEDVLLDNLLAEIEQVISGITGRIAAPGRNPFESVTATEYYSGTGSQILPLRRRPLTAAPSAVYVDSLGSFGHRDGAFGAESEWVLGEDYAPALTEASEANGSLLMALDRTWPVGQGNIKVTYTAGYKTIPDDLKLAVHMLAGAVKRGAERGALVGKETLGKYSYELLNDPKQAGLDIITAKSIIARYRD